MKRKVFEKSSWSQRLTIAIYLHMYTLLLNNKFAFSFSVALDDFLNIWRKKFWHTRSFDPEMVYTKSRLETGVFSQESGVLGQESGVWTWYPVGIPQPGNNNNASPLHSLVISYSRSNERISYSFHSNQRLSTSWHRVKRASVPTH